MNRIIAVIFCLLALSACEEKKAESPQQKMLERANMTDKEKRAADIEHLSRRSRLADRLNAPHDPQLTLGQSSEKK